jgi:Fe-S cluster assembly protein SufD
MTPAAEHLLALFDAGAERRPGRGVPWLEQLRREGLEQFREQGLPTPELEDWRFTSLARLENLALVAAGAAPAPAGLLEHARALLGPAHRAVFVNGRLHAAASSLEALPPGVRLKSLHRVLADEPERLAGRLGALSDPKHSALEGLHLALFEDGASVELAPGTQLEQPIHLVFAHVGGSTPSAVHPRVYVSAGEASRACIVEHHVGLAGSTGLVHAASELWLGPAAQVDHLLVQDLPQEAFFLAAVAIEQDRASRLGHASLALGAGLARLETRVQLAGEGAWAEVAGLYLARANQLLDHHTTVDHAVPHTTSRQLYKGALDERARGVFHGRVHVRPGAQKSDARQINRALLLSGAAVVDTKPQLEIYADDVQCSHGASIGQLDDLQLFYLRARGIAEADARALLTAGFAREVLDRLPIDALRGALEARVLDWLPRGAER